MDELAATAPKVAAAVVEFVYGDRASDPYRVGKPLRFELEGLYSARRAEYRVIYRADDGAEVVRVERVSPRRDIYRPGR